MPADTIFPILVVVHKDEIEFRTRLFLHMLEQGPQRGGYFAWFYLVCRRWSASLVASPNTRPAWCADIYSSGLVRDTVPRELIQQVFEQIFPLN